MVQTVEHSPFAIDMMIPERKSPAANLPCTFAAFDLGFARDDLGIMIEQFDPNSGTNVLSMNVVSYAVLFSCCNVATSDLPWNSGKG